MPSPIVRSGARRALGLARGASARQPLQTRETGERTWLGGVTPRAWQSAYCRSDDASAAPASTGENRASYRSAPPTVGAHRTAGGMRAPALRARRRRPAAEFRGGSSAVCVDPRHRWCGIRDRCARASRPRRRRRHETRPVARLPAPCVRRSPQAARRPAASGTRRRRPPAPPPRRSLATGPGGPRSQTTRRRRSPRGFSEARTSRARARARW